MTYAAPPGLRPLGRIVRAHDAGLYVEAAQALTLARAEAAQVLQDAETQAAAIREQAGAEARMAGEGAVARQLAEAAVRTGRELAALRPLLADAVASGVARILGARPAPDVAAEAAAHAVMSLRDRTGVVVRVPPEHVAAVTEAMAADDGLRVQGDATLGSGECVIETAAGFVRAGIAAQFERLREALHAAAMDVEGEAA